MLPKDKKTGLSRFEFYGTVALLAVALWSIWKFGIYSKPTVLSSSALPALPLDTTQSAHAVTPSPTGTGQSAPCTTPSPPSEWQKMSVTVEGNTGSLFTTLATALFGAIGYLVFENRKASRKRPMWAAFLAALCTGTSLFFGAASQGHLVSMLSNADFSPYDGVYRLLNLGQFVFLGAGACFLIGFAMYDLREET